ncbi:efflux RND transporter permease subunit [Microlunatus sp. Y2014]|uniref:efflux RND transporter permease subunit n=1 Tax=Microlunatus sp. Y2014 TaxID=3418488 RepID=UPI003DA732DD
MHKLADLSLANRALIALITVFVMAFGVITTAGLKQELIPSLQIPTAVVITTYEGASPDVVEERVTTPIEQAVLSLSDLESSSSTSSTGVSTVVVNMTYGTNMSQVQQDLQATISRIAPLLPDEADSQVVTGSLDDLPVLVLSVTGGDSPAVLADRLTTIAVPELEKLPGVRAVQVAGAPTERVLVDLDLEELTANGLTPNDVNQVLASAGRLTSAGQMDDQDKTLSVTLGKKLASVQEVADLVLVSPVTGAVVKLSDVATVERQQAPATSVSRTNGEASMTLSITKTPDGNTVEVSEEINALLPDLADRLGSDVEFTPTFDQAPFITQSIEDLLTEGGLGLVMAILVILVFLLSVRSTLVTAISIPVSILVAMIGLSLADYSLNILTLGALTIAIGRVVDDSIVVIENIKRHLSYGEPKLRAITTGVREVATAITAATITTSAVFLPIGIVGGQVGELFRPFAVTVGLALLASLLVSLTIVPVLAYWFLKSPEDVVDPEQVRIEAEQKEHDSWLQRGYLKPLRLALAHPVITIVLALVLLGGTVALTPTLKQDFLGSAGQNTLSVTQEFEPGLSLDRQIELAEQVESVLLDTEGVEVVQLTVGSGGGATAAFGFGGGGANSATFSITTDPEADTAEVTTRVREELEVLTGVGELRVSASEMQNSDVAVNITAPDTETLATATELVLAKMETVEGATDVRSSLTAAQPRIQVVVDEDAAAEKGLTSAAVAMTLRTLLSPATVTSIEQDGSTTDVVLKAGEPPVGLRELEEVELRTPTGTVELQEIAEVQVINIAPSIAHSDGQRSATVSLTPTADDLAVINTAVTDALAELDLPEGAVATLGGVSADQAEAFAQLGLALLVAIAIVYVVMVATFKSLVQPLILLVSVPFAATGALAALLITDTPLGVPSLIGVLMLVGIVVTNAIVLIDLINHYRREGQSIDDALINGARQRLRPILMTAAATIMALIPMAVGITGGGVFISQPLAIVVIGGLFSSTLLTLLLVPVLYRVSERFTERRADKRHQKRLDRLAAKGLRLDDEGRVVHASSPAGPDSSPAGPDPTPGEPDVDRSGENGAGVEDADPDRPRPRRARVD